MWFVRFIEHGSKATHSPLVRQHKHNLCGGFVLFSTLQFINGIPSDCSKPNFFDETFKTNTILKEKRKRERKTMCWVSFLILLSWKCKLKRKSRHCCVPSNLSVAIISLLVRCACACIDPHYMHLSLHRMPDKTNGPDNAHMLECLRYFDGPHFQCLIHVQLHLSMKLCLCNFNRSVVFHVCFFGSIECVRVAFSLLSDIAHINVHFWFFCALRREMEK